MNRFECASYPARSLTGDKQWAIWDNYHSVYILPPSSCKISVKAKAEKLNLTDPLKPKPEPQP